MTFPTLSWLFLDIGGVLLTNGWDRAARRRAAELFELDYADLDERHHLTFDTYEEGKLSLDDYMDRIVFFRDRPFTRAQFKEFMFQQSQPFPEMLDLMRQLKQRYGLRVTAISNEGRELTLHRIRSFHLEQLFDSFISSCFVHLRKPDLDIYRLALDVTQAIPEQTLVIDDRALFVDIARELGMQALQHTDFTATRAALAESFGLTVTNSS